MGLLVRSITIIWLFLLHLSYNYGMIGKPLISATKAELELEEELKILNKPPIKTIEGKAGDLFDCVDIYKQPAFDNPLLQNHKIQMKPSFVPKELFPKSEVAARHQISTAMLIDGGCPEGTVPIKRTTKEDLLRAKAFNDLHGSIIHPLNSNDQPQVHTASARTKDGIHFGVQGIINIASPTLTNNDSTSGAFIFLVDDPNKETIGAGWMDPLSLNWWLLLGGNLRCGYWPSALFTVINDGAAAVGWLGGVSSPVNQLSPQMGSGVFPDGNFGHSCYFLNMRVCDSQLNLSNADNAVFYTDKPACYGVMNNGFLPKMGGYAMMFGGPGGKCD
ncbi:hypothetical protein Scep_006503 [Stephania cephalantha]|uniref:Neprosin PEP catalytic domain-containing protein n=1 Tax=Stephania cephalantha TaxID=152367 RepID=A0AAP0PP34_9MAGN